MDLLLSRDAILQQARALLGLQTSDALAAQVSEQHLAAIQAASVKVAGDTRWQGSRRKVAVVLPKETHLLNYPENAGPGSVLNCSVWLSNWKEDTIPIFFGGTRPDDPAEIQSFGDGRYYPIEERELQSLQQQDVPQEAGDPIFKAYQGHPRLFSQRLQLEFYPYSRREYRIAIEYEAPNNLPTGASISVVDAQAIIYWTVSLIAKQQGDDDMAVYYAGLYADRKAQLMGYQQSHSRFAMDSNADLGENEWLDTDLLPRWDRAATPQPYP